MMKLSVYSFFNPGSERDSVLSVVNHFGLATLVSGSHTEQSP